MEDWLAEWLFNINFFPVIFFFILTFFFFFFFFLLFLLFCLLCLFLNYKIFFLVNLLLPSYSFLLISFTALLVLKYVAQFQSLSVLLYFNLLLLFFGLFFLLLFRLFNIYLIYFILVHPPTLVEVVKELKNHYYAHVHHYHLSHFCRGYKWRAVSVKTIVIWNDCNRNKVITLTYNIDRSSKIVIYNSITDIRIPSTWIPWSVLFSGKTLIHSEIININRIKFEFDRNIQINVTKSSCSEDINILCEFLLLNVRVLLFVPERIRIITFFNDIIDSPLSISLNISA